MLVTGARSEDEELHCPVWEVAAHHGASAMEATDSPEVAYAHYEESRPGRPAGWDALPWASS
jgi:hypothetical protein